MRTVVVDASNPGQPKITPTQTREELRIEAERLNTVLELVENGAMEARAAREIVYAPADSVGEV